MGQRSVHCLGVKNQHFLHCNLCEYLIAVGQSRSSDIDLPTTEFPVHFAVDDDVDDNRQDCHTPTDGAHEQQQERRCFGYWRKSLRQYHCSNCDLADWYQRYSCRIEH